MCLSFSLRLYRLPLFCQECENCCQILLLKPAWGVASNDQSVLYTVCCITRRITKKNQARWEELGGWRECSHLSTSDCLSGEKIRFHPVSIFPVSKNNFPPQNAPTAWFSRGVWCSEAEPRGGPGRAIHSTVHCAWTTWSSPEQLRISQAPWGCSWWKKARTSLRERKKRKELPRHN